MTTIWLGALVFTAVVMTLVLLLLAAKQGLAPGGEATISFAGGEPAPLRAARGETLLVALLRHRVRLPSACGGRGTCGACKLVVEGAGPPLATERSLLSRREQRGSVRLACQVKVARDLTVWLPDEVRSAKTWRCTLVRARNVATFIRELVFRLPAGERIQFRPGAYVLVECPAHRVSFGDFAIEERYRAAWDRLGLWELESRATEPTTRAYSLANCPAEGDVIMLNVRIALPPPGDQGAVPPGAVSSFLFSLVPGDEVTFTGPYGSFFARDSDAEMVYIGGGAGMAPLRSHLFDLLQTHRSGRTISFWYGARSLGEAFYVDELDRLAAEHGNFRWELALSEPLPEDAWVGPTGFIHQVVYERYLARHPAPHAIEYYLCGPPPMMRACREMLAGLGVPEENVSYDEF